MRRDSHAVVLAISLILFCAVSVVAASKKPSTFEELALYKGADRQQLLEEGAKKEGKLTHYTSGQQSVSPVNEAFEKKYPFIKVTTWRAGSTQQINRVVQEFQAGQHAFDVIEGTQSLMMVMQHMGIGIPFYLPNIASIEDDGIIYAPGGGVYAAALRSSGIGFGYNTKLLSKAQLPKTYQDLLEPRWKGKLAITTDSSPTWAGTINHFFGEDLLKKIAQQDFTIHVGAPLNLLELIVSGEYAASPVIFDSHVFASKKKGAPIAWVPLEPVRVNVGQVALSKHAPHPYAALLFADFKISKESAEIHRSFGYDSFRTDVLPVDQRYKKYFGQDTVETVKAEQDLFNRLFLKK